MHPNLKLVSWYKLKKTKKKSVGIAVFKRDRVGFNVILILMYTQLIREKNLIRLCISSFGSLDVTFFDQNDQ